MRTKKDISAFKNLCLENFKEVLHQGFQGAAPIPGHGLMQTVHVAKGHNIRQSRYLFGNLDQFGGQSACPILTEPHIGHGIGLGVACRIGKGKRAHLQMLVVVRVGYVLCGIERGCLFLPLCWRLWRHTKCRPSALCSSGLCRIPTSC